MTISVSSENEFDAVVIGGGPAGAAFANALTLAGQDSVAIVDKARFPRDKSCGDGLGPGVVRVASALDLDHVFDGLRAVENVSVSSPNGTRVSGHLPNIDGIAAVGYVIPRKKFDNDLFQMAIKRGATDLSGYAFDSAEFDELNKVWNICLTRDDGEKTKRELRTRVLVGADGASSKVRRLLGHRLNPIKYTGTGLRSYVEDGSITEQTLSLDFVGSLLPAYGWVFPIDRQRFNVGVGIDASRYKKRGQSLEQLLDIYAQFLGNRLNISPDTFLSHPLPYGIHMPPLTDMRKPAALIGDAASMINPLTGEGIFYGMYAGWQLAKNLAGKINDPAGLRTGLRTFDRDFLNKFEDHFRLNWRMKEKVAIPQFCDLVIRATSKDSGILDELVELMMGDRRRISTRMMLMIGLKGLL